MISDNGRTAEAAGVEPVCLSFMLGDDDPGRFEPNFKEDKVESSALGVSRRTIGRAGRTRSVGVWFPDEFVRPHGAARFDQSQPWSFQFADSEKGGAMVDTSLRLHVQ